MNQRNLNPIQRALKNADEMDRRRQDQISRQIQIINRLADGETEAAINTALQALDRAVDFIMKEGLWDKYQKEVLDPARRQQPQQG